MTPDTLFDAVRLLGDVPWPHGPLDAFLVRWWAGQHPGFVEDRAGASPLLADRPPASGPRLWLVAAPDFPTLAPEPGDSILVLGVGRVGEDALLPRLLADPRRLVLFREVCPFLAASSLALLYPAECAGTPERLERLEEVFTGNLDFLTMARHLVELTRENAELSAAREDLREARAEVAALQSSRALRLARAVRAVLTWPVKFLRRAG
jgi:hypothetical protein